MIELKAPARLRGEVELPASKSLSNRALAIGALSGIDPGLVENLSDCDDTRVMRQWLAEQPAVVDIGAAGTAMRFSTALLAVTPGERVITGSERMQHRPIRILVDALRQLGASIRYEGAEGFPPLRIAGRPLGGGQLSLPGSVSSQFISALLMIGPTMAGGLTLTLTGDIVSRPYIDMTLGLMQAFGASARWEGDRVISVLPRPYQQRPWRVENDWSAASYWYEMMALTDDAQAEIVLPGLLEDSLQGDSRVRALFEPLGVRTAFEPRGVRLTKAQPTAGALEWDLVDCPDLAQTLVVTACMRGLPFRFTGLQSLRIKETDRLAALRAEMAKLGFLLREENGQALAWDGATSPTAADDIACIATYDDHRMALSFAPCALQRRAIRIEDPHVVSKSYPQFWVHLAQVGFSVHAL